MHGQRYHCYDHDHHSISIIIMTINMLIINISNKNFIHGCIITGVNNIYVIIIMALQLLKLYRCCCWHQWWCTLDGFFVTYVDDEHVDNHDYDDNTDDDHDNNNDINGHLSMIYRWYIDDLSMIYRWSIDDIAMI